MPIVVKNISKRGGLYDHNSMKRKMLQIILAAFVCVGARAQVNSGSDGSDGALDFSSFTNVASTNIVIDMHDHPNGIYQYTYVNIPTNVTVTFIPNANNSPVTWLVQSNALINGTINVSGQNATRTIGGAGGPGGWAGGNSGSNPTVGQGPGRGIYYPNIDYGVGGAGSYGGLGTPGNYSVAPGQLYGNSFLLPLLGGSGGSGNVVGGGGGGGGGAILIAASNSIELNGQIVANGGLQVSNPGQDFAGGGSGGGVRLVTVLFNGNGIINASGSPNTYGTGIALGGAGRVRIDAYQDSFGGQFTGGVLSQGFQPIIIQTNGQGIQLTISTVGGSPVSANPTGQFVTPDTIIPGSETNPIPVVVSCRNLPLNTPITVTLDPANGSSVSDIGTNTVGTLVSSTATVSFIIPRGGGIIWATAMTGN